MTRMALLLALLGCPAGDDTGDTDDTETDTDTDTDADSDADSDADADADADSDSDSDSAAGAPHGEYNGSCVAQSASFSDADEDGAWFATRIEPPEYPWVLTGGDITLLDGERTNPPQDCSAEDSYEVRVFVDDVAAPPDGGGTPVETTTFPTATITEAERILFFEIDPPITLQSGDAVFLAVQTTYSDDDGSGDEFDQVTCLKACPAGGNTSDFYADQESPGAWDWTSFSPDFWMRIWGHAPE